LPLQDIEDDDLRQLYLVVIGSYIDKIDQFKSIGTPAFLYDSLRYYGEPSQKDIRNAHFVLHLPQSDEHEKVKLFNASQIQSLLASYYRIICCFFCTVLINLCIPK
jgi:hypothetical protein